MGKSSFVRNSYSNFLDIREVMEFDLWLMTSKCTKKKSMTGSKIGVFPTTKENINNRKKNFKLNEIFEFDFMSKKHY